MSPLFLADAILDEADEAGVVVTTHGMQMRAGSTGEILIQVERCTVGERGAVPGQSQVGARWRAEGPWFQPTDSPWLAARAVIPMVVHRRLWDYHRRAEKDVDPLRALRWSARAAMVDDLEFESMEEAPFAAQLDQTAVVRDTRQGNMVVIGVPRGGSGNWAAMEIQNGEISGVRGFTGLPEAVREAIVTIVKWRVQEP